ncbi:major facilitator superfamily domain-containing protein [Coniochaeta sp. 2T2.1]|nr:major facilitator superfamily domain-containing protein [Coniochaeta sp. 2T2.1]
MSGRSPFSVHPPGTVLLVDYQIATDTSGLVLSPTPSDDPNEPLVRRKKSTQAEAGSIHWVSLVTNNGADELKDSMLTPTLFATSITVQVIFWQQMTGDLNVTMAQLSHAQSANYFVAFNLGSFLVPMAAGAQAATQGWRWSYYALAIALTVVSVLFIFVYEETKCIPVSEGRSGGTADPPPSIDVDATEKEKTTDGSAIEITTTNPVPEYQLNSYRQRMRLLTPSPEPLWKAFFMPLYVITLPHVLFTAVQFAAAICWLVLFLAATSVVFSAPPYNFNTASFGYMSTGPFIGNLLGSVYGGPLADWCVKRLAKRNGGIFEPEMRLWIMPFPILCMAGAQIMFGLTGARGMDWIYPSVGGALFAFGLGGMADIAFTLVIDTYRELTAEAFIGVAFLRNAVSIGIPSALIPWLTTMGLGNMYILIGSIALAVGLLFVPLLIWGRRIRTALAPRYYALVEKRGSY